MDKSIKLNRNNTSKNCALKIKSIKDVSSQNILCKMSGIISGIHSIKHIRYMRYKSKKVHVIDSFIGNCIFSFSFHMNIIVYVHMLGNIGVVCMMIRYYWPAYVYTW